MNKNIAQTGDPPPRNIAVLRAKIFGKPLGRFADDFQLSNDRVLSMRACQENVAPDGNVASYLFDSFENMTKIGPVAFHRLTASWRT